MQWLVACVLILSALEGIEQKRTFLIFPMKALEVARRAENDIAAGRIDEGIARLEALISSAPFRKLDRPDQVEILALLCSSYQKQGQWAKSDGILQQLLPTAHVGLRSCHEALMQEWVRQGSSNRLVEWVESDGERATYALNAYLLGQPLVEGFADREVGVLLAALVGLQQGDLAAAHLCLTHLPTSTYTPHLLHAMGLFHIQRQEYDQARDALLPAAAAYRQYEGRGHMLYLAARACDALPGQAELARSLRKELVTDYTELPFAAESYFRFYEENEYQRATPHAIEHLKGMRQLFPEAPLARVAALYIGLAHKQPQEALPELVYASGLAGTSPYLAAIAATARLQQGKVCLQLAAEGTNPIPLLEQAQECFHACVGSEALYHLALTSERLGYDGPACEQYEAINDGSEWAVRSHLALGDHTIRSGDGVRALEQYALAEQIARRLGNRELMLEVSLAKSGCYKRLQQFDRAMTLLSQVINANYASTLRIKAMLLRAEIYALQKRHDLAIKQLEFAAKKGGEWGHKAQQQLNGYIYGYNELLRTPPSNR